MSISQQLAQLLSASPGNLVFHLVTLFALQAILALAWWRAQREAADSEARRLAWTAGSLLLARLLLLVTAGILATVPPERIAVVNAGILPPLEQSLNTITLLLLCWALTPRFHRAPRLTDAICGISLLLIAIISVFFTGEWYTLVSQGSTAIPYNASPQTFIWGILQLGLLFAALLVIWRARPTDTWLRLLILGVLTLGHLAHLWNYPEPFPSASDIPYWVRLGQLVALPLLAAFAYRANLYRLLQAQLVNRPATEQLTAALKIVTPPLAAPDTDSALAAAIHMVSQLIPAHFVAIAAPSRGSEQHLLLRSVDDAGHARTWWLTLDDWPALQQVMVRQQTATLSPDGLGARQLFHLYQELGISGGGLLHLLPLAAGDQAQGVLLVAAAAGQPAWSTADLALFAATAGYLAPLLVWLLREQPLGHRADTISQHQEQDDAYRELQTIRPRLAELENQLAAQPAARTRISALEAEVDTLRAALAEAEEAVALAATQVELSPEWIMRTVTRYSAELEEAQSRIHQLQQQMAEESETHIHEAVVALAQELRSPMMVIAGYTELLLSETTGRLHDVQRDFLRRIKGSSERMGLLLQQIVHMAEPGTHPHKLAVCTNPIQAIDAAVDAVAGQMRQRALRLYLNVSPELPALNLEREHLYQIVAYLLENACRAAANGGSVFLRAQANHLQRTSPAEIGLMGFLHLSVTDTGNGILPRDRALVFRPHLSADEPLIAGLGETGVGLATVRSLVLAQGGRVWVDSETGQGSTFTVLLPIPIPLTHGPNGDGTQ